MRERAVLPVAGPFVSGAGALPDSISISATGSGDLWRTSLSKAQKLIVSNVGSSSCPFLGIA